MLQETKINEHFDIKRNHVRIFFVGLAIFRFHVKTLKLYPRCPAWAGGFQKTHRQVLESIFGTDFHRDDNHVTLTVAPEEDSEGVMMGSEM